MLDLVNLVAIYLYIYFRPGKPGCYISNIYIYLRPGKPGCYNRAMSCSALLKRRRSSSSGQNK